MDIKLNPAQSQFYNALFNSKGMIRDDAYSEYAFYGAYSCGKSVVCCLMTILCCMNYPKTTAVILRHTYKELIDSILNIINEFFPPETFQYHYHKTTRTLQFHNGSTLDLRAYDNADKIKGNTYNLAYLSQCEELSEETFTTVLTRLRKQFPHGKSVLIHEGNPAATPHIKNRIIDTTDEELKYRDIYFIKGNMYHNRANLPPNYIEGLKKNLSEIDQSKFIDGNWDKVSDMVYNALRPDHVIEPLRLESHVYRCCAFDHGVTSPSAIVWGCKDAHENIYIYSEWYKERASLDDIANAALRFGRMPMICDTSIKNTQNRGNDFGSVWGDLQQKGLHLVEALKANKQAAILRVNALLHQNKLFFFKNCKTTYEEHQLYAYKKDSEDVIKKRDHTVDAVQYLITYLNSISTTGPMDIFGVKPRGPTLREATERHEPKEIHGGYLT